MEIRNRLFPYPVLCGDTDDYSDNSEFVIEPSISETTNQLILNYDFSIKCESLESLIRKGAAEFVLHIECSTTSFRKAIRNGVPHIKYFLNKEDVNGEIALVAMIVAKKEINDYSCTELNEDYAGLSISFMKGSILAYQNLPSIYITKKTDELSQSESFFTVVKQRTLDPDEIRPLEFNLHNDKIQIIVDEKTYDSFIRYQHSRSIALSLLVFPAVTYMIHEASTNYDSYTHYAWFQRINKYYESIGRDFIDILAGEENPTIIAQEMLKNPISNAYRDLYSLEEQA